MSRAVTALACAALLWATACEPTAGTSGGKTSPPLTKLSDGTYTKISKGMRGTWVTKGGPVCKWKLVANYKQVKRGGGAKQTIKIGSATTKFESRSCGTWRRK